MPHKIYRHRLLLDENFPVRSKLPRLNSRFDLKHITEDLKESGISDGKLFKIAVRLKRLLVTFNDRHFREKSKNSKDTGVIGVSTNLSNEQIDKKLTSLLIKSGPKELFGKFSYISGTSRKKK